MYSKTKILFISILLSIFWTPSFGQDKKLKILFTSDLHSCVPKYPYLASLIKNKRDIAKKGGYGVLTLDAGDFSMGTLYSVMFELDAAEYRAMALMGYDAFIFGNHEFDVGLKSLAYMFYNSRILGNQLNPLNGEKLIFPINVTSNIGGGDNKTFTEALNYIGHTRYLIYKRGGVKVGLFGLLGKEALLMSKVSKELQYAEPIDVAKDIVKELKEKEVDFIIALSHSGAKLREGSEDFALAKACPDIDLIISGHDHEKLDEVIKVGKTAIVSSGANGEYLGEIDLIKGENKEIENYRLTEVTNDIQPDESCNILLELLELKVEELFRKRYNISHKDILIKGNNGIYREEEYQGVKRLNYEIAKALFYVASQYKGVQIDSSKLITIVPQGVVRDDLKEGDVTYHDIFNILSLGRDSKKNPGSSLVLCFLTGKELKRLCEINTSISAEIEDTRLTFYGLKYTFNSKGIKYRRVLDVFVHGKPIKDNLLYPVVTDIYTAESIQMMKIKSHGILYVEPKNMYGDIITNFKNVVIEGNYYNGVTNSDMTEWLAFAFYLKDKFSGEPLVVSEIEKLTDSFSLPQSEDKPSLQNISLLCAAIATIILLIAIIWFLIRKNRRKYDIPKQFRYN